MSAPRITIVISPRERHSLAEATLESIVALTPRPYRLIYLDIDSPAWLRAELAARAGEWGLEIVRFDAPGLWPHEARARIAERLDSEYAVFIDNDVRVHAGWLEHLVGCADETGAGMVGPLYLWGDGVRAPRIHMAGGDLTETREGARRVLAEAHGMIDQDPNAVALARRPCDFLEFHCMLVRRELLVAPGFFDRDILCIHEHIDASLRARALGFGVWFEPASKVEYLAFAEYLLDDLALLRWRWAEAAVDAAVAAFAAKWHVIDDARSFGGIRRFAREHVAEVDPIHHPQDDAATPIARAELEQTRSGLLDLAARRGYDAAELAALAEAYHLAHLLSDGGYRPCGRPFVNHLAGTASVLLRYGFRIELVAAALLHAAYSHAAAHPQGPPGAVAAVCAALGGRGSAIERRVRAYSWREQSAEPAAIAPEALAVGDAELAMLSAANELDMHLAGEFRYSGRTDAIAPALVAQIAHVADKLGVPGIAAALVRERAAPSTAPAGLLTRIPGSYRIAPDKRGAVRMMTGALAALEPPE